MKEAGHDQVRKVGDPHWAALRLPSVFFQRAANTRITRSFPRATRFLPYILKLLYVCKKKDFLFDHSVMSVGIGNGLGIVIRIGN